MVKRFAECRPNLVVTDQNQIAIVQQHTVAQGDVVRMVETRSEDVTIDHASLLGVSCAGDPDFRFAGEI